MIITRRHGIRCCSRRPSRSPRPPPRGRGTAASEGHPRRHHRPRHVARAAFTDIINADDRRPRARRHARSSPRFPAAARTSSRASTACRATRRSSQGQGVEIVDSIPALLEKVDVVLLESVDGRTHLEQARPVFEAGKPVFIDKPLAGSLADAIAIAELAQEAQRRRGSAPRRCASAPASPACANNAEVGDVVGCDAWSPCLARPHPPRPVLVRHPRRRDALHDHGPRLRVRHPHATRRTPTSSPASGPTAASARSAASARASSDYGATVFGTKGIAPHRRRSPATSRSSSRSPSSSGPASRRSRPRRRSRSSRSWKPPTRASGRAASR